MCTLDVDVWENLMHEASEPPKFYDCSFEFLANDFLKRYYDIAQKDFTASNISEIYCNMAEHFAP